MVAGQQTWTLASTVASSVVNFFGYGKFWTAYVRVDGASSGSIAIRGADNSSGPWAPIPGLSTNLGTTNTGVIMQYSGPLEWVQVQSSVLAGSMVVRLVGTE